MQHMQPHFEVQCRHSTKAAARTSTFGAPAAAEVTQANAPCL